MLIHRGHREGESNPRDLQVQGGVHPSQNENGDYNIASFIHILLFSFFSLIGSTVCNTVVNSEYRPQASGSKLLNQYYGSIAMLLCSFSVKPGFDVESLKH